MLATVIRAAMGELPFDSLIRNVRIVNVFNDSVTPGCIGIVGDRIAYVGAEEAGMDAGETIDGCGSYALPGLVDSHMHLESSMLTPAHFASVVLPCGTTTVAADPHEIANVMGREGVAALMEASAGLPLRILMMAPSTIPSAPGFEDSGYAVDASEMERLLNLPGIHGLGEVMDFNGVAAADPAICAVVEAAARRGCILDGHASLLTGRRLQAFRAAGIDSDHTLSTGEKLLEELALGFTVQVQESMLNESTVSAMNTAPIQNRICLVTDDVPLPRLMHNGHLNHVAAKAVALGLDPLRAIRYTTINPAQRLRLHDVGGIAPGMRADLILTDNLTGFLPRLVLCGGETVARDGRYLPPLPAGEMPLSLRHSMEIAPLTPGELRITAPALSGGSALVNLIHQDGVSVRTKRVQRVMPITADGVLLSAPCLKMAVCNRYGKAQRGLALIDGMDGVEGAVALTYGHDCHNLTIYGGNDEDMALAANTVIQMQGGICAAQGGLVVARIPLPLAGLLCDEEPAALLAKLDELLAACRAMGFCHNDLMSFFTVMPLAVSPEIKCTDRGLLDVASKRFLPLIEPVGEERR